MSVSVRSENAKMVGKLAVVALGMFAFGYVLIPIYKHICELTGINILSLSERQVPGNGTAGRDVKLPANSQVDKSRTIRSEEHTSELQSQSNLVCRLLLEKKKTKWTNT